MKATLDALRAQLGTQSNIANATLERAFASAYAWVEARVYPEVFEDDEVQEAILLLGGRLYKRKQSPEGVAGWGDLGVIRIIAADPDIERLLEWKWNLRKVGLA